MAPTSQDSTTQSDFVFIRDLNLHKDRPVRIRGWLMGKRGSNKFQFLTVRDGSGRVQAVASKEDMGEEAFSLVKGFTQECALIIEGQAVEHEKKPGVFEIQITGFEVLSPSVDYPITPKEHGVDFLHNNRHLWLRSRKPTAILRVRNEIEFLIRKFFYEKNFTLIDTPILTQAAGESSDSLFKLDYFNEGTAGLAQTGQLYLETAIFAFGQVYCFGPTFRAEKSKTRKHLTEFWMLEAEMAFYDNQSSIDLQEELIVYIVQGVLEKCRPDLETLERDLAPLEKITGNFKRLDYDEAVEILKKKGSSIEWGMDLGAEDETLLVADEEKPVFVLNYPAECKAFYMKQHPSNPKKVLCADLIAPEGYGEVIGGSQREEDIRTITRKLQEKDLDPADYEWYLDLRKYGSVPHSGFGLGLERLTAWMCGIHHVREAIPYPRLMGRLTP